MFTTVTFLTFAPAADERDTAILAIGRDERAAAIADGLSAVPDVNAAATARTTSHRDL